MLEPRRSSLVSRGRPGCRLGRNAVAPRAGGPPGDSCTREGAGLTGEAEASEEKLAQSGVSLGALPHVRLFKAGGHAADIDCVRSSHDQGVRPELSQSFQRLLFGLLALALAALAAVWLLYSAFAATPCGIEGRGVLKGVSDHPVQFAHVAAAVLGFPGSLVLAASALVLLCYASSGSAAYKQRGLRRLGVAGPLALAFVVAVGFSPAECR